MPDEEQCEIITKEEMKELYVQAVSVAIDRWLEKKFADFGRWTFYGFVAAGWAGLVFLLLFFNGWKKF